MESNSVSDLFKVCIRFLMLIFIYFTTIVRIIDVYMYLYIYIFLYIEFVCYTVIYA